MNGETSPFRETMAEDYVKWKALAEKIIEASSDHGRLTLYNFSALNQYNYVFIKALQTLSCISQDFIDYAFTPIYSFGLLKADLNSVPSVVARGVEKTFALGYVNDIPTYKLNSAAVFTKATDGVTVHLSTPVQSVKRGKTIKVTTAKGEEEFDIIVFACNANSALNILTDSSFLEKGLLGNIEYDADVFTTGYVHTDDSVIPEVHRAKAMTMSHYFEEKDAGGWEYNIILSDLPIERDRQAAGFHDPPMFATFNTTKHIDPAKIVEKIDNTGRVPAFTFKNQLITKGLTLIQGNSRAYFCGSAATPGDCHDFSFVSGLIIAHAIDPSSYTFGDDPQCKYDFDQLRSWMGV